jgi:hypothetical protein
MSVFRRLAPRILAPLLAGVLALGATLPLATHAAGDDSCDQPAAVAGGQTTLRAAPAGTGGGHCEICHWLRLLRGFDTVAIAPLTALHTVPSTTSALRPSPGRLAITVIPARAPPA